jgi:MoaA/NifB/PqqE/SkfB family radical SAM enzyme
MLSKNKLYEIISFIENMGVQEIILIAPFKTGRLIHSPAENFYNEQDTELLFEIMRNSNRKFKIKISSELTNCHANHFGCAAGMTHSHINAAGELHACEIAAMSFGNVLNDDLPALWTNMQKAIAKPHSACLASEAHQWLQNEVLPVPLQKSLAICAEIMPARYPAFYRNLMGGNRK